MKLVIFIIVWVVIIWFESTGRGDHVEVEMSVQAETTSVVKHHSPESRVFGRTRAGFEDSGFEGTKLYSGAM